MRLLPRRETGAGAPTLRSHGDHTEFTRRPRHDSRQEMVRQRPVEATARRLVSASRLCDLAVMVWPPSVV